MKCIKDFPTIKTAGEFDRVYKEAHKTHLSTLVFFYKNNERKGVGFTASKKIGNAVKRNLAKRRMRALFASYCDRLKGGTYVLVAKKEIIEKDFDFIEKEFSTLLRRYGV